MRVFAIVTDVHYRMSLALIRELGQAGVELAACEKEGLPALGGASRWCKKTYRLPAEGYADALLDLCRRLGQERSCRPALLPVGAGTLELLARERERFEPVCGLSIPTAEQLAVLNSKSALADLAETLDIPVPERFVRRAGESDGAFFDRLPLPCVVKPDWGEGLGLAAGARYVIARTREQAQSAWERFSSLVGSDPVVQAYLPGDGLGCSILADGGRVLAAVCHRRVRQYPVTGGPSACCESVTRPELERYAGRVAEKLDITGLAMFEFKEDAAGQPKLLEVNPRIWGSFPLTRASHSGMAALWCALAWNAGNRDSAVPLPKANEPRPCRMAFTATDLAAGLGYIRAGQPSKALRVLADALDPRVKDGVFEWGDPWPGLVYLGTILKRSRER